MGIGLVRVTVLLTLLPAAALAQTAGETLPAGTPLALTIDRNYRMREGEVLHAHLLYPVYAGNQLVLSKDTVITGTVVALQPDRSRRTRAMLGGDFTPFRTPEVRFDHVTLADGSSLAFTSGTAAKGTPMYRAVAPPPSKGGFLHREFDSGLAAVRHDVAAFTAPGKGDRFVQFIYSQIPYHPQRIEKGTSWTIETTAALDVPAQPEPVAATALPPAPTIPHAHHFWNAPAPAASDAETTTAPDGSWIIQANLADGISSESSHSGQAIQAVVAQPIFNPDHSVAVPQGATLVGTVTRAKPARAFGRTGVLNFRFSQLVLPNQEAQAVETKLTGADSTADIALNSEGEARSRPQDKIAIPLFLAALASRPLDQDCGHRGGCSGASPGKDAAGGAAGLGLVGTIIGLAGGSPYAAAGIGYFGAARAFFNRWIAHGQKISFAKDTRIVVQTTPRRSAPIKPDSPTHDPR